MGEFCAGPAGAVNGASRPSRWRSAVRWGTWRVTWWGTALTLAACGGGGGEGGGGSATPDPPADPAGSLYVGYYVEDATDNPEDPTIGAVMLRLPAADGAFAGQMPFSYAGCASGSDVGAIRGTRSGAQIEGNWSGTMDGVAVGGGFALAPDAAASSYSGQWRNAAGKQPIAVGGCRYHVASSGAVTLYPGSASVPAGVALTASSSTTPTVSWSGLASGARSTLRLFDATCLEADPSDAACFLGEASTTATSLAYPAAFGSTTALTPGRSYLWVLTAQAASGAFAGFAATTVMAPAADPAPGPGPGDGSGGSDGAVRGRLSIGGSGAAALGGAFVAGADVNGVSVIVVPTGPLCIPMSKGVRCSSTLAMSWTEWSGNLQRETVGISFTSVSDGEPGPQPGTAVTSGGVVVGTADGRVSFSQWCDMASRTAPCATLADLGITLDPVARTVTFVDAVLPALIGDGGSIVVNGRLSY